MVSFRYILAVSLLGGIGSAGVFTEIGDAGDLPGTAQWVFGSGSLTKISGNLTASDADMYAIWITGGGTFSATTYGDPDFDSQLFLFNSSGMGVYANDDANEYSLHAALPAGHALTPMTPGIYYLAFTRYNRDPVSSGGLIFPDFPWEGVFGPTESGGEYPISGYTSFNYSGAAYEITLTGAEFIQGPPTPAIPGPAATLLVGGGLLVLGLLRRLR